MRIKVPKKIAWIFAKPSRYKGAYGGRGSGKSMGFALMAAIRGSQKKTRILCARELQVSIKDSVIQEITDAIQSIPELDEQYDCGVNYIKHKTNGTEFIFKGLKHNSKEIKSTAKVDICWIEEAETVSEQSWRVLIPTIRNPNSEIWLTWNPEDEESATHKRFILNPPNDARILKVNYNDNPFFPDVLEEERKRDLLLNPDTYSHIWEGEVLKNTDAQIFKDKWTVEDFEEHLDKDGTPLYPKAYFGSDFGFSQDPTTINRMYIYDRKLWITHDASGARVDTDQIGAGIYERANCTKKDLIRSDCARPETISYLKKQGWNIIAAKKWAGSIEDGIAHIRSYEQVIIHPRCKGTIREFKYYSYKIDPNSGDVTRKIVDANNHHIDGIRYGLDPMIKGKMSVTEAMRQRNR